MIKPSDVYPMMMKEMPDYYQRRLLSSLLRTRVRLIPFSLNGVRVKVARRQVVADLRAKYPHVKQAPGGGWKKSDLPEEPRNPVEPDAKILAMQEAMHLMGDAIAAGKDTVPHRAVQLSIEHDFELFRDSAEVEG